MENSNNIEYVGNVGGVKTQGRSCYMPSGISPTLTAGMDHGNTMPYIIIDEDEKETKEE